ncbi:SCO2322 family protein [Streptomyces palmae]|uniref:Secreted protein n=2 Tax=Streptomyces palmae TaxID=1701085 RepID=A0A4Z0H8V1_9ACTN|nr:SCO2322 family protein [Streptomyces palmae]TGB07920.1 hypothetical protein E4099_16380 [Streptomyces palmae]
MCVATPAHAAGYRYWSFWQQDGGKWSYATQGPATARPGDGDTVGFRYAVSEDSRNAVRPRGTSDFATICAHTPAREGSKRVAVVIDFGTAADAADGGTPPPIRTVCAQVRGSASAADALAAVAKPLRYDSAAVLCAIAGYPASGCAEAVADGDRGHARGKGSAAADDGGDSGPSAGLLAGATTVLALGGAAIWQARRRRT